MGAGEGVEEWAYAVRCCNLNGIWWWALMAEKDKSVLY